MKKLLSSILSRKYPGWDITIALRYFPITKKLADNSEISKKTLEVGSGEFGIMPYLNTPQDLTGVDLDFGEKRMGKIKRIKSSAEKLPFPNNSFSEVISVDTLEHLSKDIRKKAIFEMVRVAKSHIYLAFPRGKASKWVDSFIARYYLFTHRERLGFLEEHSQNKLPTEIEVTKSIKDAASLYKKTYKITKFGNTNIFLWLTLLLLGFSETKYLTRIFHYLLLLFPILKFFNLPPTYRAMIFVEFNNA